MRQNKRYGYLKEEKRRYKVERCLEKKIKGNSGYTIIPIAAVHY